MGTVLYAVPGTDTAKEAVLDAQIPQTASINRSKANLTVKYDGPPKFEKISSTSLSYAVNTATPVIKVITKEFYAVDNTVWFLANSATVPWTIATKVPEIIYTIPPDSPLYNITFVKIYKVEPEIIYVGYTPGYTHTYGAGGFKGGGGGSRQTSLILILWEIKIVFISPYIPINSIQTINYAKLISIQLVIT
jgi:hypothetical protein